MCFESGTFFVENGFRPAIVKKGRKWAFVMFLDGSSVRCKRVLKSKVSNPKPIGGSVEYTTERLAAQFLSRKTLNGTDRFITKRARTMLKAARS